MRCPSEAEVAAGPEESDDGEDEGEGPPADGDPGPVAFAVGEDQHENGGSCGVKLGGFDGGAGRFETEPAGGEIEEGDYEREGDEAEQEAGVEIGRGQEGIDIESADERGEREEMCMIGEVFGGKGAADDDEEECGGGPDDRGPDIGER